jgi:hypothetical protein
VGRGAVKGDSEIQACSLAVFSRTDQTVCFQKLGKGDLGGKHEAQPPSLAHGGESRYLLIIV